MIIASMATIPSRREIAIKTIESIKDQVDIMFVALNYMIGTAKMPEYPNVKYIYTNPRLGDSNKFYPILDIVDSYLLTCDDDLLYPPTYVEDMIEAVDVFGTFVTLHGMVIHDFPLRHFYDDPERTKVLSCLQGFDKNYYVHVVGTGVSAWHSSMLRMSMGDFLYPNMADIWVSIALKKAKMRPIAIRHPREYLTYLHPKYTIFNNRVKNDSLETEVVNKHLAGWF